MFNMNKQRTETNRKVSNGSFSSLFMHADRADMLLMVLGLVGAIGEGMGMPAVLYITSNIMNSIGDASSLSKNDVYIDQINKNAVNLCYVALAKFVACFFAERQASKLRSTYLKAVLRQEIAYFDLNVTSTADIITSVSSDSLIIQEVLSEKVPTFVMNITAFIGAIVVAFILLWRLAIVGLPFILLLVTPSLLYRKVFMSLSRKIREEYNKVDAVAEQAISSVRTVYSFVGESKTIRDYSAALQGAVTLGLKQGLVKGLVMGSNGVVYAVWAFLCWYGSRLVMYHGARGGTVCAVGSGIASGGLSFGSALATVKYLSDAMAASERISEVIKRVPAIDSYGMDGLILQEVSGEVQFKNVTFAYPSRPESVVFDNFNLKVPAGMTVALVGGSGFGKSTVIALLQRFYDPQGGEICVDGVRIDKLQLKWLRSQMGLVSQEPILFATTVKENILFGKEDATMEEVIEAAKVSNAHNFISQLPQAYDTQVGERGIQMSGGQKQRISIARAIIKSPRILLLDEATSALDSGSERVVQEALDRVAIGRTTIVIAHRLSTIRNADLIMVVQNGQVVESGSHNELIQLEDGCYTSLVRLQETKENVEPLNVTPPKPPLISSTFDVHNTCSRRQSIVSRSSSATSANSSGGEIVTLQADKQFAVPSFKRLLATNISEWKHALLGSVGAILCGAVQPGFSFSIGSMISVYFLADHDEIKKKTMIYTLCFAGLGVFSVLINIIQHYNFAAMGEYLTKKVREKMLSNILTFEIGWFDGEDNSSGAICSRLATDANLVRSLVGDRCSLLIQTLSAMTVACTTGLVIAWRYALVLIAVQPLIIICYYCRCVLLKNMSQKAMKSQDESSKLAAEAVSNLRTIISFSSQTRILKMLKETQKAPMRESIRQAWYAGLGLGFSQSLMACTWALGYWYGGTLISDGHLGAKAFFQTYMILVNTGRVIGEAGTMTNDLAKGSDAVESVFAVLDRDTLIDPEDPNGKKPDLVTGHVEICDIVFAYPARPDIRIFNGFSINIEAGKSTALVGQSGSGKSTIIGLIERFYDPMKGAVKVDGMDIKLYHLRTLRRFIALVSQEPALFAGSIRENIIYGASEEVSESEIVDAAKAANAHDFITVLKDGFDTWCGERGVQLSGGQKQRIAVARAILKNPTVLLLDEATSALDSQSEKLVQDALDRMMVGRTSVVVAHRLSTIQSCDTIAVLEKGAVVEIGNHGSLLAKEPTGTYYSLVNLQKSDSTNHSIDY
uniref:ABC transporter B family member 15-like isoform X2 n=1 Tax=Erigeron canadensis TaxID=72917 RepID=UPI001CB8A789|nr:ABC transporter B family member 15-like isoform X2 [Erigeron canadensis]